MAGVWENITPHWVGNNGATRKPEMKPKPIRPTVEDLFNDPSRSICDLNDTEKERYENILEFYRFYMTNWDDVRENLLMVYTEIMASLSLKNRSLIGTERSVRIILQNLKRMYEPSLLAQQRKFLREWDQLRRRQPPQSNIEDWIPRWLLAHLLGRELKLCEFDGELYMIKSFLSSIRHISPKFYAMWSAMLCGCEDETGDRLKYFLECYARYIKHDRPKLTKQRV
ncbi:hypothetical protein N7466_006320 [Penicillium verhagenii]|uniref:uncharacterized protein n=1 Tax=Penicillium verhagenii TaxID=1562060 RepID=UPI0025456F44|nr:uncharacterized protein N7466_006320 [Penicillium verhagenii]KAJ5930827.1 hypothetical protein N7466_006320 [Penicillium verhagenii]